MLHNSPHILVADDHAILRQGLVLLLQELFPHARILQSSGWSDVHHYASVYRFKLMLLDVFMPSQTDWAQELQTLLKQQPDSLVCMISSSTEKAHIETALKLGAKGYICKTAELNEMKQALLSIYQGKLYLPPQLFDVSPLRKKAGLTARQQEILKHMAQGETNQEIAQVLFLTENTVKRHISTIYQILEVNNRTTAIATARQRGLLEPH